MISEQVKNSICKIKTYAQSIRDNEPAELEYGTIALLGKITKEANEILSKLLEDTK